MMLYEMIVLQSWFLFLLVSPHSVQAGAPIRDLHIVSLRTTKIIQGVIDDVRTKVTRNSLRPDVKGTMNFGHRDATELKRQNQENVANMMRVIDSDGWTPVVTNTEGSHPITVWKKNLPPGTHGDLNDAANDVAAEKFACIKASAVVCASPREVYKLFLDNERVNEYNEHCHQVGSLI